MMNHHPQRVLRATLSNSPGVLTSVVQVFSSLTLEIERLDFQRPSDEVQASALVVHLRADDRMVDLALRKLGRLVDVLSAHEVALPSLLVVPSPSGGRAQAILHSA